jgi:hypothetical protein
VSIPAGLVLPGRSPDLMAVWCVFGLFLAARLAFLAVRARGGRWMRVGG